MKLSDFIRIAENNIRFDNSISEKDFDLCVKEDSEVLKSVFQVHKIIIDKKNNRIVFKY